MFWAILTEMTTYVFYQQALSVDVRNYNNFDTISVSFSLFLLAIQFDRDGRYVDFVWDWILDCKVLLLEVKFQFV